MTQAIQTKYYGPTNSRGGRIKATCEAKTIWVPWDYAFGSEDNHKAAALALMSCLGWRGKWATGSLKDAYVHVQVER